ncbi:MAG TPA: DEAD/DEAH box helicase [Armatimonadetes bacterium]|nr:DEAD/DEAH box helicase [Armatimonadota bacterium]
MKALAEAGYKTPTPIQAQAIPLALQGDDILGCAQTGTGKTAAFALPILHRFSKTDRKPRALILAPTRELASQIEASFAAYGKHLPTRVCALYGGVPLKGQIARLRKGVDVIVATPGRLMDHMERRTVGLSGIEVLVLDEADRMLDMGFEPQVRAIAGALPANRQTMLFSATVPPAIEALARRYLRAPKHVEVERSGTTVETVDQRVHMVAPEQKTALLARVLQDEKPTSTLIFTRTKRGADRLTQTLRSQGFKAEAMHGDLAQNRRERIIRSFRSRHIRVLVATDVAARGLDIPHISHVINYDVPEDAEAYVHRIGRTARAQRTGVAITLASAKDKAALAGIERLVGQSLPRHTLAGFDYQHDTSHITSQARSSRGGGRNASRADAVLAFLERRYGSAARASA